MRRIFKAVGVLLFLVMTMSACQDRDKDKVSTKVKSLPKEALQQDRDRSPD